MTTLILHTARDGEPRITDENLAAALEYPSVKPLREVVWRHRDELAVHGLLPHFEAKLEGRGRPRRTYLFNEKQALLVCMFARTPKGAEVRRAVVETFAAWRKGTLKPYKPAPVAKIDPSPKMVESFHLRQDHDGLFTVTLQTRRHDVARSVMESCLAPLLA